MFIVHKIRCFAHLDFVKQQEKFTVLRARDFSLRRCSERSKAVVLSFAIVLHHTRCMVFQAFSAQHSPSEHINKRERAQHVVCICVSLNKNKQRHTADSFFFYFIFARRALLPCARGPMHCSAKCTPECAPSQLTTLPARAARATATF